MSKSKILILAMIPCVLWASVFPVVKLLFLDLGIGGNTSAKLALAGMRFFLAGVLILITSFIMNKKIPIPRKNQWGRLLLVGLFQTTGLYSLYYISLAYVTGVKAAVISQAGIFYMIILAVLFLGEKIKKNQLIGIFFGFLGILVLNITGLSKGSDLFSFTWRGEGLLLLSGVFGSLGQIIGKKRCGHIPAMTLNGWQMTLGGGVLLIIGLSVNGGLVALTSVYTISLMLYSVMVAAVGFTIWYYLLQNTEVNNIVPYRLSIPVLGSLFSATFLPGESITINIFLGLVFVVVGMYILSKPNGRRIKADH